MVSVRSLVLALLSPLLLGADDAPAAPDYAADARAIERLVNEDYAYLERFDGGHMPMSDKLRAEAETVDSREGLIRYAERALTTLADHHAITGASLADSWALVPSYADLWVELQDGWYVVTAVRQGSSAAAEQVGPGDRIAAVDGMPMAAAVEAFWADLGLPVTPERASYAARVLVAGRRNAPRKLSVIRHDASFEAEMPSLYAGHQANRPPLTVSHEGGALTIRFNDSLGDSATIAAFDEAMAMAPPRQRIVLDLTDTASGGNTSVARAIMGWFVDGPTGYQVHSLPAEERQTGIPRQWIEQVLPRPGKHHDGPVTVRVGRWTGSMGEGLALGFDAIGARVEGGPMAGLLGAVYDHKLEQSGLVIKIPVERLFHVDGTPRERFMPRPGRSGTLSREDSLKTR
jgi:C-terminal processing protease CtpA/Prc